MGSHRGQHRELRSGERTGVVWLCSLELLWSEMEREVTWEGKTCVI